MESNKKKIDITLVHGDAECDDCGWYNWYRIYLNEELIAQGDDHLSGGFYNVKEVVEGMKIAFECLDYHVSLDDKWESSK